jgi:hypothetical protein
MPFVWYWTFQLNIENKSSNQKSKTKIFFQKIRKKKKETGYFRNIFGLLSCSWTKSKATEQDWENKNQSILTPLCRDDKGDRSNQFGKNIVLRRILGQKTSMILFRKNNKFPIRSGINQFNQLMDRFINDLKLQRDCGRYWATKNRVGPWVPIVPKSAFFG